MDSVSALRCVQPSAASAIAAAAANSIRNAATNYSGGPVNNSSSLSTSVSGRSTTAGAAASLHSSHHVVPLSSKIRQLPLARPLPASRTRRHGCRKPLHGGDNDTRGDRLSFAVSASSRRSRGWDDPNEGARKSDEVQRMLVDIVRLQMGEVRMNSLVEERSARLRSIARDSHEQLDRIADRTMKGVDDLSDRVLRQLDAGAYAIERDLEKARLEMEAQQKDFEEFERRVFTSRNEGLFFKTLYSPSSTSSSLSSRRRRSLRPSSSASPSAPAFRQSRAAKSRTAAAATAMSATAAEAALLDGGGAAAAGLNRNSSSSGLLGLRSDGASVDEESGGGMWDAEADGEWRMGYEQLEREQQEMKQGASMYRRILHAGMSLVLVSFLWSSTTAFITGHTMRFSKVSAYTAILSVMLLQLKFEKAILGEYGSESDEEDGEGGAIEDNATPISAPPVKDSY
ncbi:hypothetical protein CLOP_g25003 [Closterium sp. NIES-67]|nr:hypothetical protein CLOP_g25003 [Closterium sp. NIES-67]